MIDFTSALPDAVTVNGRAFLIKTDFRVWLKFDRGLEESGIENVRLEDILQDPLDVPDMSEIEGFVSGIMDFYINRNPLPKDTGGSGARVLDYYLDGDYIYAAFLEQYGIDLVDIEYLHWYKFQALIRSISDNTMLGKIMSYRGYKNSGNKSYEKQMQELKYAWGLPTKYTEEEQEQIDEFNNYFG